MVRGDLFKGITMPILLLLDDESLRRIRESHQKIDAILARSREMDAEMDAIFGRAEPADIREMVKSPFPNGWEFAEAPTD
jgi:hypothetical protein